MKKATQKARKQQSPQQSAFQIAPKNELFWSDLPLVKRSDLPHFLKHHGTESTWQIADQLIRPAKKTQLFTQKLGIVFS